VKGDWPEIDATAAAVCEVKVTVGEEAASEAAAGSAPSTTTAVASVVRSVAVSLDLTKPR
jgi:hypothetical protein